MRPKRGTLNFRRGVSERTGRGFGRMSLFLPYTTLLGAIRGYAKITKDITENRKVEEEKGRLRSVVDAQRVLFQAVVEHAPAGIAIYDGETFRVKWANPIYQDRFSEAHCHSDIVGRHLRE